MRNRPIIIIEKLVTVISILNKEKLVTVLLTNDQEERIFRTHLLDCKDISADNKCEWKSMQECKSGHYKYKVIICWTGLAGFHSNVFNILQLYRHTKQRNVFKKEHPL